MKHLTLLLALFAFLAVGCAEETEIETPAGGEIEYEEETDLDAEMDELGNEIEEGAQDVEGTIEEGAQELDQELDGDAEGL